VPRKTRSSLPALIILTVIATVAVGLMVYLTSNGDSGKKNTLAEIGGPFELVDSKGQTVRDTDFRGTYLLVYFGYTFCPDICPTSLNTIAEAFDQLPPGKLAHIQALFVSVDPERDSGAVLDDYTQNFHPRIKGLTGTREQINDMVSRYRGTYRITKDDDPDYYPVDHSSIIYLMDENGKYVTHFSHQSPVDKVLAKLNEVLPD